MDVIQFFKDYGTYLCAGLVVLFDILLLIVKRRPQTIDDFEQCLSEVLLNIPGLISRVECPGNGEVKKSAVLKACIQYATQLLGRDLSKSERSNVLTFCSDYIESVLSTPTKKGE